MADFEAGKRAVAAYREAHVRLCAGVVGTPEIRNAHQRVLDDYLRALNAAGYDSLEQFWHVVYSVPPICLRCGECCHIIQSKRVTEENIVKLTQAWLKDIRLGMSVSPLQREWMSIHDVPATRITVAVVQADIEGQPVSFATIRIPCRYLTRVDELTFACALYDDKPLCCQGDYFCGKAMEVALLGNP